MDQAGLVELLAKVQARPRMFLPDERYTTLVGFISGCDVGADGALLHGLNDWLATLYVGGPSSIVWWSQVADHVYPDQGGTRAWLGDLDEAASQPVNEELIERLREYLSVARQAMAPPSTRVAGRVDGPPPAPR